jgi:type III secretion protein L
MRVGKCLRLLLSNLVIMSFVRFNHVSDAPTSEGLSVTDKSAPVLKAAEVAVWQDAQQILAQARLQAEQIVSQAQQAFEAEKQRGYQEGLEQAQMDQTDQMIETASRTVDYFAGIEQRIVGLVMQSMRRVIADFSDTERVMAVVRSSLAVMRNQKQLTLRLAPDNVDVVKQRARELLEDYPGVGLLDIVADPRLQGDAAILESELGVVQASIEKQLQAIEQSFTKILGSRM